MPVRTRRSPTRTTFQSLRFDQTLVLNQWMLSLFEVNSFDDLARNLKDPELEGFTENNVSRFCETLKLRLWERHELNYDLLMRYDENIVSHWLQITQKRNPSGPPIYPKYFQYLTLLFTEVYLDRYFINTYGLMEDLNQYTAKFNAPLPSKEHIPPYTQDDLRKLAFWNATGSGKTLLMHVNILQYMHYLTKHEQGRNLNRVILLTPNEGLSLQHLAEFELSGLKADLFEKDAKGLFASQEKLIEIIDIHKLREETGETTIAVDAFESNNLVLVDEGHRGSSGEDWKSRRDRLCENGFTFEYSATFGQAMKAANKKDLTQEYAKCILFDYSYKYFYKDGYGKDYRILNLADDSEDEKRWMYLTACLLVFYQQQKLYRDQSSAFRPFLIESPLWVFVGGSVTKGTSKRDVSDVMEILLFLFHVILERRDTEIRIERLLSHRAGLIDSNNRDIFFHAFRYLEECDLTPSTLFDDILKTVFNSSVTGKIHLENLKGSDGEVALRLGDHEPFGLINVGDAAGLCKKCEDQSALVVTERDFSGSLFNSLNQSDSTINILIGSKKFMEGWNSWRVSTMGLMNIGKKEGSQIIQLFGRGVRLKGKNFNLKRSRYVMGANAPEHINILETLNIFGIRADYMQQFKEYLEEEGLPSNESLTDYSLPVVTNLNGKKLKILKLKDGIEYKKDRKTSLEHPQEHEVLKRIPVSVDWYPKIQAQTSKGASSQVVVEKDIGILTKDHLAFMNWDEIYFELQKFKNERTWYNLNLSKARIKELLLQPDWYTLYIPQEELRPTSFKHVRRWQEIAIALLKKYTERYYLYRKSEYESPNLEYTILAENHPNFPKEYQFLIEESMKDIVETLDKIKESIKKKEFNDFDFRRIFQSFSFPQHLYQPLLYCGEKLIQIKPVPLNEGEKEFVLDLRSFCEKKKEFFQDKELYLLRNMSKGRGIGFFEAGNFHPDFILWLLIGNKQYISFVDPKGIRNLEGPEDPKIKFFSEIKKLEQRLNDPDVILNSFIISNTSYQQITWWDDKKKLEDRNVLFQKDDKDTYIEKLMARVVK